MARLTDSQIKELRDIASNLDPSPEVPGWICEALPNLLDEVTRSRALLKRIQWADESNDSDPYCPDCGRHRSEGHQSDCELVALLGAA